MTDGRPARAWNALRVWIRKPESWLSIAGAALGLVGVAISSIIFYLGYAKPGDLEVYLAEEVGLSLLHESRLSLGLPVTLVNTVATAKSRVVEGISAIVTKRSVPSDSPSYSARWSWEYTFVGKGQYLQRYPTKAAEVMNLPPHDFLDNNGRALPFTVQGGSSISKVLGLVQEEGNFAGTLGEFTVKLRVRAGREAFESEAKFNCGERPIEEKVIHYCRRKI